MIDSGIERETILAETRRTGGSPPRLKEKWEWAGGGKVVVGSGSKARFTGTGREEARA